MPDHVMHAASWLNSLTVRGSRLNDLMHSGAAAEETVSLKRYHCQPQWL